MTVRELSVPQLAVDSSSPKRYGLLIGFASISTVLLALGGWLTSLGLGPWYYQLEFPPFQPPPWVFTPAWIVVLSLLAVSTWLVARCEGTRQGVGVALGVYGAQCVLNVGWSLLFFAMRRPDVAFWSLLVLDMTLIAMILAYARVSKRASLMLLPYFAWLILATAINGWIVRFN